MSSSAPPMHRTRSLRRVALTALTISVAAAGVAVAARSASAAVVDPAASYVLVNRNSGKALDVYNLATTDGAAINQYTRNDGAWQQWKFLDSGSGWYRLQSVHSGKVLDLPTTADGVQLVQNTDRNDSRQQFRLADSAGGHVRLINRNSGKALETWEWSTADGAKVSQYQDLDGANQQWQLARVGAGPSPTTSVPGSPGPSGTPTTPPAAYPGPGAVSGATGTHDPTVVKTPQGSYIVAQTGDNIRLTTSTDRTTFREAGAAFPNGAPWTTAYTGGSRNLWAPDISYRNGQYYLYYSASTFGSNRSAIFLATSPTGASGSWTNRGLVIESSASNNYNAIDPNLIVDDAGRWWLNFGSFWSGMQQIALNPSTGLRADSSIRLIAGRNGGAIEAPHMVKHGSFYYLWVSFDRCCQGAASTYRIMVGRSTSPNGPFVDRNGTAMNSGGGTQVLAGHGSIHGPGHQAVLQDTDGDVLVYHYYADNGASRLGINRLGYDSAGWPFVY
jgi:arabinan endo-1,5-alpha-L-arabinosidase